MGHINFRSHCFHAEFCALQNGVHFRMNRPHTMSVDQVAAFVAAVHIAADRAVIPACYDAFVPHNRCSHCQTRTSTAHRQQNTLPHEILVPRNPFKTHIINSLSLDSTTYIVIKSFKLSNVFSPMPETSINSSIFLKEPCCSRY